VQVAGELTFPDHHAYPPSTLRRIRSTAAAAGARAVLTTGKDRVKLLGRLDLPLAELPVAAHPEAAFWSWLDARLGEILSGSGGRPAGAAEGGETYPEAGP
jgi:tetraacyldisaccharide-1-P 4'-kinase